MLQRVGSFGKFQKMTLFLLAIPIVFDALTTMMLNFIFGKQLHRYVYMYFLFLTFFSNNMRPKLNLRN